MASLDVEDNKPDPTVQHHMSVQVDFPIPEQEDQGPTREALSSTINKLSTEQEQHLVKISELEEELAHIRLELAYQIRQNTEMSEMLMDSTGDFLTVSRHVDAVFEKQVESYLTKIQNAGGSMSNSIDPQLFEHLQ